MSSSEWDDQESPVWNPWLGQTCLLCLPLTYRSICPSSYDNKCMLAERIKLNESEEISGQGQQGRFFWKSNNNYIVAKLELEEEEEEEGQRRDSKSVLTELAL